MIASLFVSVKNTMDPDTTQYDKVKGEWSENLIDIKSNLKRSKPSHSIPSKRVKHDVDSSPLVEESNEEIARQYKKFINAPKYDLNSEELFCVCRRPDLGEMMVACDGCEEWFHFKCMKINEKYSNLIAKYYCKFCEWKGEGNSQWKRKCRLENCNEPIGERSKYCSKEHGIEFIKLLLLESKTNSTDSPPLQNLDAHFIKDVLNYVSGDFDKLQQMGSSFPELEVVKNYKNDNTALDGFPETVKTDLQRTNEKLDALLKQVTKQEQVLKALVNTKDNIKHLNERLTNIVYEDLSLDKQTSKKKKGARGKKKIDICFCDKGDQLIVQLITDSETIFDDLLKVIKARVFENGEAEEEDMDWFMNDLCIKDKKKCVRHSGWWNLYYDEAGRNLEQLQSKLEETMEQKETILRNYSISVYES